ncbi:MAG: hypothetical protein ABI321_04775 [Polyangia bacterium]
MKRHLEAWVVGVSLAALAVITLAHCGGSSCGNGKQESGESCDKGKLNGVENSGCSTTCEIAQLNLAGLQIFVSRLQMESKGYTGALCSDLKAATEHVVLEGPSASDGFTQDWNCSSQNSLSLPDVTPGDYKVTITLLSSGGTPITKPVSATATAAKGSSANLSVNFKQTDFIEQDYTGTLFFTPSWGEDSTGCITATPQVTGYGVTLKDASGALVSGMSTFMRKLDGTSAACFVPLSNGTAEGVMNIPWGHYTIAFTGYSGADITYCGSFDVFNGPSVANPTFALTVPSYDADGGACN